MYTKTKKVIGKVNDWLVFLDKSPLWWLGILVAIVTFVPCFLLGEESVFAIHDQLDETILAYIFNARHLGEGGDIFPEMMGGINKTGIQPSAILFVPLYRFLEPFLAFFIQYLVVVLSGYVGMHFLVKRITGSSILAVVVGVCFCMLPIRSIYGLSVLGVPLLAYAFMCLYDKQRVILAYIIIAFFALTTHLVLIGYGVLGVWACYIIYMFISKKRNMHVLFGFLLLLGIYVAVNYNLFIEVFVGSGEFISHREEFVHNSIPFWTNFKTIFISGDQHTESLHKFLVLPIFIMLVIGGFLTRKKESKDKYLYYGTIAIFVVLIMISVFCALLKTEPVVEWKNSVQGFFHYFQMDRVYWMCPFLWYLEFALIVKICWCEFKKYTTLKVAVIMFLMLPTVALILSKSNFYTNINQLNNGSDVTGYVSWESYYAEDLMKQLDEAIGRDKSDYRIVHLGINPAPALMYGFYTVDGYSNNYSLDYKHKFREVIADELDKNEYVKIYYDTWGSRCYLFNYLIGDYVMISKNQIVPFEDLEFNMEKLSELGCEYLFSGGEILDAEEMGLEYLGYFETDSSYWGIWLYKIKN